MSEITSNSPFAAPVPADAGMAPDAAPQRPDGLLDRFWSEKDGVKLGDLVRDHAELSSFKDTADARAALVPEEYAVELPQGYEADGADPMWETSKAFAKQHGLSQQSYNELVGMYVELEQGKAAQVEKAQNALADALGGRSRLDVLEGWFASTFDSATAAQLKATLWSPSIVGAFEALREMAGGTQNGSTQQPGRMPAQPQARADASPQLSARDQRTLDIMRSMQRR
jgi:hypothetical protein